MILLEIGYLLIIEKSAVNTEENKPHFNIMITTPGHSMDQLYVTSLIRTIKEIEKRGLSWGFSSQYSSDVACAREWTMLGQSGLKHDWQYSEPFMGKMTYDKVFLIDSDIEWEPEDFFKLYESDLEAVTGVYLQGDGKQTTLTSSNYYQGQFTKDDIMTRTEPFEVVGAGMGFVCLKSGILENIPRPWFTHMVESFPRPDGNGFFYKTYSEDISFVMKMKDHGFTLHCDPSVRVNHIKKGRVGF